jgi:2-polyprenyl-3-methyl-5-hydroxy-6-metoxy-1,4-benzoquinol methylase
MTLRALSNVFSTGDSCFRGWLLLDCLIALPLDTMNEGTNMFGRHGDDAEPQQRHPMVQTSGFGSAEELVLYLIHHRAYEEAARLLRGRSILDWGCNNGYGIEVMARLGCSMVAGLDVSATAIESARMRLGPSCELHLYDGHSLPVERASFDAVTCFQCV